MQVIMIGDSDWLATCMHGSWQNHESSPAGRDQTAGARIRGSGVGLSAAKP